MNRLYVPNFFCISHTERPDIIIVETKEHYDGSCPSKEYLQYMASGGLEATTLDTFLSGSLGGTSVNFSQHSDIDPLSSYVILALQCKT